MLFSHVVLRANFDLVSVKHIYMYIKYNFVYKHIYMYINIYLYKVSYFL